MLKALTIRSSMIAVVAALTLALIGTIWMSIQALGTMQADEEVLAKQIIPTIAMSNDLTGDVVGRHLRLNMHLNSLDSAAMTTLEAEIRSVTTEIEQTRAALTKALVLPASREALKRYEALVPGYLAGVEKVLDLSRRGDKAAAGAQLREMRGTLSGMETALKQLVEHVSSRATVIAKAAEDSYATAFYLMMLVGLAGVLIAAGSVAVIVLRITRPLVATTGSMDELAKGNLDTKIGFTERQDEIGTMARALQIFQDNLQKVRALEEQERAAAQRRLQAADSMASIVSDVGEVVAAAAAGDFSARLQIGDADPQMQKLVAGIN
ncbi:HAMP domain-containing protein, partial [Bosea sp. Leaf344]|uniref:HAMP domain-containing protein n=1 Tax=Bosea sp. Leaf344 TaxID=1736346 RepID=UPI00138F1350